MEPYELKEGYSEIIRVIPPDIGDPFDMGAKWTYTVSKKEANTVLCKRHTCPICEALGFNGNREVTRFELMDLE
jgi:hypothetical protein